jgi:hypothetical protein
MAKAKDNGISFDLSADQQKALRMLAGGRKVRLGGTVVDGKLQVNFIACNSPFVACNAPFSACNSPFAACNAPFAACNSPFSACNAPFAGSKPGKKTKKGK